MKTWMFGALALAMTLATGVASACPTGNIDPVPQRPRPVNNVSFQATQLFERAQQLETAAASHERSAAAFERDAETLANRARLLRNQANLQQVSFTDRQNLVAVADELSLRASSSRAQASEERQLASNLHAQARVARERALELVRQNGVGGGWGGRGKAPVSTSSTADIGI
jgi:DNA-binding protein H-NS